MPSRRSRIATILTTWMRPTLWRTAGKRMVLRPPLRENADEENGDEVSECDGVEESDVDGDIVDLMLNVASISGSG
ncbi:unnamed protein product [Phytophthora fragariaefolia]|uniref:Unnamed protein product n=1 Tax=Phytophthora fragariaefolia TaxID=1490495 RepID=A0A9W6YQF3_9STRA|nr:unnamed protein product [Phytophthora fragariaefolia]